MPKLDDKRKYDVQKGCDHFWIRNVPRSLKTGFKAWCALRGITMSEKIISLMRECVKEQAVREEKKA
jgi:hypothetical protein